jgi:hypothetical protein
MNKGDINEGCGIHRNEECSGGWFRNIKGLIERPRCRCEDRIKMGLHEVMCEGVDFDFSDEHSVFIKAGKLLTTWLNTNFSRKAMYPVSICSWPMGSLNSCK